MVANLKMMKWSPWPQPSSSTTRKFQVTVNQMKIEQFIDKNVDASDSVSDQGSEKIMMIQMKWKGSTRPGLDRLVPLNFNRSSQRKNVSTAVAVMKDESTIIEWNDKFENDCVFPIIGGTWIASFTLSYGLRIDGKPKLTVIGKLNVNLAEIASEKEAVIVKKFPIKLTVAGDDLDAVLSISFRFIEVRNSQDSSVTASPASQNHQTMSDSSTSEEYHQIDSENSDESPKKESDSDEVKRGGFFSWKRRRLSFFIGRKKVKPSTAAVENFSGVSNINNTDGKWELKEIISRDNKSILTSPVFLSSFDQRSEKAAGESACTALVAIISNWLHSHPKETPTRSQFDTLIIEGSSEWRKLCLREDLINLFPDKHFDMETVLGAGLRPVGVCRDKSFVGFFGAEKFECLKGFGISFDQIWDKISENEESRVYIVSWNDHFFILKVENGVYYIIDTLGERLFEGCQQAFILRFDESSVVQRKIVKEEDDDDDRTDDDDDDEDEDEEEEREMVCEGGKESCKEFLKRFLAAIPLEELEDEERKKGVSYLALHHRLQIEFDLTLPIES